MDCSISQENIDNIKNIDENISNEEKKDNIFNQEKKDDYEILSKDECISNVKKENKGEKILDSDCEDGEIIEDHENLEETRKRRIRLFQIINPRDYSSPKDLLQAYCRHFHKKEPVFDVKNKRMTFFCSAFLDKVKIGRSKQGNKESAINVASEQAIRKLCPELYSEGLSNIQKNKQISINEFKSIKVDDFSGILCSPSGLVEGYLHKSPLQALRELASKAFPATKLLFRYHCISNRHRSNKKPIYNIELSLNNHIVKTTNDDLRYGKHCAAQLLLIKFFPNVRTWHEMLETISYKKPLFSKEIIQNAEIDNSNDVLNTFLTEFRKISSFQTRSRSKYISDNWKWKKDSKKTLFERFPYVNKSKSNLSLQHSSSNSHSYHNCEYLKKSRKIQKNHSSMENQFHNTPFSDSLTHNKLTNYHSDGEISSSYNQSPLSQTRTSCKRHQKNSSSQSKKIQKRERSPYSLRSNHSQFNVNISQEKDTQSISNQSEYDSSFSRHPSHSTNKDKTIELSSTGIPLSLPPLLSSDEDDFPLDY